MKKLLILGAGTAGTIMANKMRKALRVDEWNITYVTTLSGAFTKPKASKMLGSLPGSKNINLVSDFFLEWKLSLPR
jgi:NADH dehydrogenase FAD-containing subunit